MIIRQETPEDIEAIGKINDEAFGRKDEGQIVSKLRESGTLLVSLVAIDDGNNGGFNLIVDDITD